MELAPLSLEDVEAVRHWRNEMRETLRTPFPLTQAMQADFYRDVICRRESPHRYWALIGDAHDAGKAERAIVGDLLGMGGLTNILMESGIAEISLMINPDLAGKGLGTAAVTRLLEEGFDRMRLATICGEVYGCNQPAWRFWQTVVADHRGVWTVLPRRKFWAGRLWDSLYFTLTAEEWATRRART